MPARIVVEALSFRDIPHNLALARAVGWQDEEAEWRVIYEAALVLGVRHEGQLIGQGALGLYEGAGTIAKMVVAPSAQRKGVGAAMLDALLAEAERRALSALGLVATPFGHALYESRGFASVGEVAVFMGTPVPDAQPLGTARLTDLEAALAFEERFIGCSRTAMLRGRFREASATAMATAPDGAVRGFAMATAQGLRALVGPVIADSDESARTLVRAIFAGEIGAVRIDVPSEQTAFREWLGELGLPEVGVRAEMARGGALPWRVPQRFALATQAWG